MGLFARKDKYEKSPKEKARVTTLKLRETIKALDTEGEDVKRPLSVGGWRSRKGGTPYQEVLDAERAEIGAKSMQTMRKDWVNPEPIRKALVELCLDGKIRQWEVIKFESLGHISGPTFELLEKYLAQGYMNAGIVHLGKPATTHEVISAGKRVVANPWYFRIWKFLTKKRSFNFWRKDEEEEDTTP